VSGNPVVQKSISYFLQLELELCGKLNMTPGRLAAFMFKLACGQLTAPGSARLQNGPDPARRSLSRAEISVTLTSSGDNWTGDRRVALAGPDLTVVVRIPEALLRDRNAIDIPVGGDNWVGVHRRVGTHERSVLRNQVRA
jgi:hypothetical protein